MNNESLKDLAILELEELEIDRKSFSCSVTELDDYFHKYVSQDVKKNITKCFVLINKKESRIIGYYTLSCLSVSIADIPKEKIPKGIPYPHIPSVLIGRLAIDDDFQNQGYGGFLIADIVYKVKNISVVGAALLVVDSKNDNATAFYKKYGFSEFTGFQNKTKKLFLNLKAYK